MHGIRRLLGGLAVLALLATVPAPGADGAIVGEAVVYEVGGSAYEGYYVRNTALGDDQPVVVIVHDWDGLGDYEKHRARMLAEQGYAAFALDLYGRGIRPRTTEQKRARSGALYKDRTEMRARLAGALAQVSRLDGADPERIVAIGYCFGGSAVLELARAGRDLDGFVSFHGGLSTRPARIIATSGDPC